MAEEQSVGPVLLKARLQSVVIYEVSELELDTLERGGHDSVIFTICVTCLSAAVSLTAAGFTIGDLVALGLIKLVFFSTVIVFGYGAGIILLLIYMRTRKSVSECVRKIRARTPTPTLTKSEAEFVVKTPQQK